MIDKLLWGIRAVLYAPFFGSFGLPSYLGKPLFLKGLRRVYVGKKVRIFPHLRMETTAAGSINIGNDTVISQNVHITAGAKLDIGNHCLILANSFITDIDHDYTELGMHVVNQKLILKKTTIGDYCFIGMGSAILAGTTLGKQCVVGANSVVRGTFPDYCVIAGAPAKIVKMYNPETNIWEKVSS